MYFPHENSTGDFDGDGVDEYCGGYWIASPNTLARSDNLYCCGHGGWVGSNVQQATCVTDSCYGLRPVVCLDTDVKFEKNSSNFDSGDHECWKLVK